MFLLFQGLPINTNMLALLPGAKDANSVEKIADDFANTMGKQIVILVGNPNQDKALQASDVFSHRLQQSNYFSSVTNGVSTNEQEAWASFYFPYRLSLLSDKDSTLITQHDFDTISQQALFNLYNPIGISNSKLLQNDPFSLFQHFILALPKPSNKLDLYKNHLITEDNGIWYSMINATLKDDSFSLSNQNNITHLFGDIKQTITSNYPPGCLGAHNRFWDIQVSQNRIASLGGYSLERHGSLSSRLRRKLRILLRHLAPVCLYG
ncbi:MAG: hypothetical protein O2809_01125 [Proteobacteria bacterium]|nr:hypothetical protein [Pseudomonadota bacterium]